jgi:hypothetical protein
MPPGESPATPQSLRLETIPGVLEKLEIRKDTVQVAVESAFSHVGQIAAIVSSAGREVTRELGEWATEVFEMREAARRAEADRDGVVEDPVPPPFAE